MDFELNNKYDLYAVAIKSSKCTDILGHLDRISAKKVSTFVEDWIINNPRSGLTGRNDVRVYADVTEEESHGRVMIKINDITLKRR